MRTRNHGRTAALLAILFFAGVGGCGTTKNARLKAWHTAQYDVSGIERLAVLGFRAPADVSSEVENTALEQLRKSGFYQVTRDPNAAQFASAHIPLPTDPGGMQQIVARGRQLGADAVLVGRVRKRLDKGAELGRVTIRIGDPELGVMIEYYVVDVHTGSIRAKQQITRTQSKEAFEYQDEIARAADSMVKECTAEMVANITAGSEMIDIELATLTLGKGSGYLQDGNKLAGEGKWQQAAEEYRLAMKVNPDCHQAIYNLGLAAEAQGRFGEAEAMYNKAIKKSDESLYRDALARVANAGSNYQLARRQIAQRPRWRFRREHGPQSGPSMVSNGPGMARNGAGMARNGTGVGRIGNPSHMITNGPGIVRNGVGTMSRDGGRMTTGPNMTAAGTAAGWRGASGEVRTNYQQVDRHSQIPSQNAAPYNPSMRGRAANNMAGGNAQRHYMNQPPQRPANSMGVKPPAATFPGQSPGYQQYQNPHAQGPWNQQQEPAASYDASQGNGQERYRP